MFGQQALLFHCENLATDWREILLLGRVHFGRQGPTKAWFFGFPKSHLQTQGIWSIRED